MGIEWGKEAEVNKFGSLRIEKTTELPNGRRGEFYRFKQGSNFEKFAGSVVVAARSTSNNVWEFCLVRQYRWAVADETWEFPRGGLGEGETPEECATRELLEETGHTALYPLYLGSFYPDSGILGSEVAAVFCAVNYNEVPIDYDEAEEVVWVTIDELRSNIQSGKIKDGMTLTAFTLFETHHILPL